MINDSPKNNINTDMTSIELLFHLILAKDNAIEHNLWS